MGAGASTASSAYSVESKAALIRDLDASYQEGGLSDVELYAKISEKFENWKKTQPEDQNDVLTDLGTATVEASASSSSPTTPQKPGPVLRVDSVADVPVVAVEETGIDEHDENINTDFDESQQEMLQRQTSVELLADMVNEQQQQESQIASFLGALQEGKVPVSKSSQFRKKRLTYEQKTVQDPEPRSPEKMLRARTTIYASSEIGVRQEKTAPFGDHIMGTFSCHGIEPGQELDPVEDEDEEIDEDSCGPPPHDKINQDRGCVVYPFKKHEKEAIFLVLDGHGEQGDKISEFVMRQLVVSLEKQPNLEDRTHDALKETFTKTNMALMVTPINYMTSGTTCVCVYVRGNTMFVANCGDSRAVMAVDENGSMRARDLSKDHKPDDPSEQARIEEWGGFVKPAPEPGLSARVYLDQAYTMIGLAMARSLGDYAVKSVGVIPEPEVTEFECTPDDKFMIMASDGVWEFIGSQEAVDIVQDKLASGSNCTQACQELIEQASQRWAEEEGDYRDDITAIIVKFPLPFQ